jgi:hypothetical protein
MKIMTFLEEIATHLCTLLLLLQTGQHTYSAGLLFSDIGLRVLLFLLDQQPLSLAIVRRTVLTLPAFSMAWGRPYSVTDSGKVPHPNSGIY